VALFEVWFYKKTMLYDCGPVGRRVLVVGLSLFSIGGRRNSVCGG
jgi:hypothetical protein